MTQQPHNSNHLDELVDTQNMLREMSEDLAIASDNLAFDNAELTRLRAIKNATKGLRDVVRTLHRSARQAA